MKVIANHFLDPRITLKPNVGTDKSWVWGAFDFSDNELVEQVIGRTCWSLSNFLIHHSPGFCVMMSVLHRVYYVGASHFHDFYYKMR